MHGMNLVMLKVFYLQYGYLFYTMARVGLTLNLNKENVHVYGVNRTYSKPS